MMSAKRKKERDFYEDCIGLKALNHFVRIKNWRTTKRLWQKKIKEWSKFNRQTACKLNIIYPNRKYMQRVTMSFKYGLE